MLPLVHPADGTLWRQMERRAPELAAAGITSVWLPPVYKGAAGAADVGYSVYDLYGLGEFDQQGSIRTRYSTRLGRNHHASGIGGIQRHLFQDDLTDVPAGRQQGVNGVDLNQIAEPFRADFGK
jgi:hypothetical protein